MTIERMQSDVFRHFRGFAVISALLDWQYAPVGTACTNGSWCKFDPAFLDTLNRREQTGLALHEILHIVRKHHLIRQIDGVKIDHQTANEAFDYWINRELVNNPEFRQFAELPQGGLLDSRFDGLDERQIYRILLAEKQANEPKNDDDSNDSESGEDNDAGNDDENEQGENESASGSDQDEGNDEGTPEPGSEPGNGIGGVIPADESEEGTDEGSEPNPLKDPKQIDQILQSAAMASTIAGKSGGLLEKLAGDAQKPTVNWQAATKRHVTKAVKTNRSWQQMDRRYRRIGISYPAKTFGLPEMDIFIDSSTSQSLKQINADIAEVRQLVADFNPTINLYTFTETVVKIGTFKGSIPKLTSVARGGTSFDEVIRHIDNSPAKLAIVLTDGYDTISKDTQTPIIWIWTLSESFGSTTNSTKIRKED